IKEFDFDILSLNGIQYDFKDVPSKDFDTTGLNISKLIEKWSLDCKSHFFTPSNLGMNAKSKRDGTYFADACTPEALAHADDVNFGTLPGQISSGGVFKHKILDQKIYTDLLWQDFNPNVDFGRFKTPGGADFPEKMKLFDKSFSDITIDVEGKSLHIILLHATPSYHFGNPKSINGFRNAEQLRFLEWYVSGETDYAVDMLGIRPLKDDDYYMIVGDLNVDVNNQASEGSGVLRSVIGKATSWIHPEKIAFTTEAPHFRPNPLRLVLDYIIVSKNIDVLQGKVIHPNFDRGELGCGKKPGESPPGKSIVTYRIDEPDLVGEEIAPSEKKDNRDYHAMIENEYLLFKEASYHYPIYGEFRLRGL
ncbi:endonuclease/exonuclease/phosphatase family protein, partial [Steroidobacter cummioxidans]|uniref:endonuclease/exonuclease/phosphatase family protein n=1 Tax=Steroidobacter cummioxidans TaxID=1803913 RepID=UPI001379CA6C